MGSLFLEAAHEEDLGALLDLQRECLTHPWTEHHFRAAMVDPGSRVLVLREPWPGGDSCRGILGYCVFQVVTDELHIHDLAVRPARSGRGLGRRLLALTLEIAVRRGARSAFLEVRQSNQRAQRLYDSMGFRAMGVRRGYYAQPAEDAWVLCKPDLIGTQAANLEIRKNAC